MSLTSRADLVAELEATNTAIRKAIAAESYAVGDQSATRNVRTLREHRAYLEREIAAIDAVNAGAPQGGVAIGTWDA